MLIYLLYIIYLFYFNKTKYKHAWLVFEIDSMSKNIEIGYFICQNMPKMGKFSVSWLGVNPKIRRGP